MLLFLERRLNLCIREHHYMFPTGTYEALGQPATMFETQSTPEHPEEKQTAEHPEEKTTAEHLEERKGYSKERKYYYLGSATEHLEGRRDGRHQQKFWTELRHHQPELDAKCFPDTTSTIAATDSSIILELDQP